MPPKTADRIEKTAELRASRARVWKAIADSREFGTWFGAALDGAFVAGKPVSGRITHPGFEHLKFELDVERIEPERLFAFRWHPYAVDPKVDYSSEPTTLVELRLAENAGATRVTIVESGFERIPAARRDEAFRMNGQGWEIQLGNLARHVAS